MIRHIVVLKVVADDTSQRDRHARAVADSLRSLKGRVPDLLSISVGVDDGTLPNHWDVVLVTEHPSFDALAAYQIHPHHREVVEAINPLVAARAVADYDLTAA